MASLLLRRLPALLLLVAACGPVSATSVISDAEAANLRAHKADGERLAPYEMTSADLYLAKAREEQGRARYAEARELAQKSASFAEQAARKAAAERDAAPPAAGVPPAGAPAAPSRESRP